MLNAHPEIVVPPECGFALWFFDAYGRTESFSEDLVKQFAKEVLSARKMETWGLTEDELICCYRQHEPRTYIDLVSIVYICYGRKFGKNVKLWGDKNNYYIKYLQKLNLAFPLCKKVFIVRDGRDVACSYLEVMKNSDGSKYHPVLPTSIQVIAEEWSQSAAVIAKSLDDHSILVKFESLLRSPSQELARITDFLQVSYTAQMLRYFDALDEPKEFLQWKRKLVRDIDLQVVGRHKDELSDDQLEVFVKHAGNMLKMFNYAV